jgi:hypothetical protein
MADPERPLPLATVIWFGSLEFMSLGHGYDMVLLPHRHLTDGDHELFQPRKIHYWNDLVRVFEGNFKGTYMCPGNSWDLRSCKQKPGKSL